MTQYKLAGSHRKSIEACLERQKNLESIEKKLRELDEEINISATNVRANIKNKKEEAKNYIQNKHMNYLHPIGSNDVEYGIDAILERKRQQINDALLKNQHIIKKSSHENKPPIDKKPKTRTTCVNQTKSDKKPSELTSSNLEDLLKNQNKLVSPSKIERIQNKIDLIKAKRKILEHELIKAEDSMKRNLKALELKNLERELLLKRQRNMRDQQLNNLKKRISMNKNSYNNIKQIP
ncbi:hypothetical protein BY996DRAFT_6519065 [Phakopsora pachyrhizi]|nr:hypothetical protein BY996DRAFT_6519065 [Phakopsora pachyrhizi]